MSYCAQHCATISNVRHISQWFSVACDQSIANANAFRPDGSSAICNWCTYDVSLDGAVSARLESPVRVSVRSRIPGIDPGRSGSHNIRRPVEHLVVDELNVILAFIVPHFAFGVEGACYSHVKEVSSTCKVTHLSATAPEPFRNYSNNDWRCLVDAKRRQSKKQASMRCLTAYMKQFPLRLARPRPKSSNDCRYR